MTNNTLHFKLSTKRTIYEHFQGFQRFALAFALKYLIFVKNK
jgi:hypothetical protein